MADTQSILQLGIEAARAGDKAEARELFRLVTREDPSNAQGWLWLAGVAEDREEKRAALERVAQIDPSNDLARKGLAALGVATAGGAAAAAAGSTPTTASSSAAPEQDPVAEPFGEMAAPARSSRANVYEQPEQVGSYVPPDFGDDDYDLSEYQSQPRAEADDQAADDRDAVVVVEDEEPRRRGLGLWLPAMALLLLLLGVLGFLLFRTFNNNTATTDPGAGAVATNPDTSATAEAVDPNAASDAAGASADAAGLLPGSSPSADGSPSASSDAAAGAAASDPGAVPSVAAEGAASVPAEGAASAPADGAAASVPADAAPSVPAEAAASVPAEAAPSAAPEAAPSVPAEAAPSAAPEAAPSPPVDVAAANPAIVGNDQILRGGNFEYGFSGLSNVATGSYGGAPPARGRYLIVLMTVRNAGSNVQQIPDGFFVVKDAQGRVSDFNRAASVDYINRFGGTGPRGAGDYAADTQLVPGAPLGSMPLLFDVASDATELVVFSRENPSQGFRVQP